MLILKDRVLNEKNCIFLKYRLITKNYIQYTNYIQYEQQSKDNTDSSNYYKYQFGNEKKMYYYKNNGAMNIRSKNKTLNGSEL